MHIFDLDMLECSKNKFIFPNLIHRCKNTNVYNKLILVLFNRMAYFDLKKFHIRFFRAKY